MLGTRNWREHFRQFWPTLGRRLADDAATIGQQHKLFLADLAIRGSVYAPILETDPIAAARAEGKRQLALETIKLCGMSPETLTHFIEGKP